MAQRRIPESSGLSASLDPPRVEGDAIAIDNTGIGGNKNGIYLGSVAKSQDYQQYYQFAQLSNTTWGGGAYTAVRDIPYNYDTSGGVFPLDKPNVFVSVVSPETTLNVGVAGEFRFGGETYNVTETTTITTSGVGVVTITPDIQYSIYYGGSSFVAQGLYASTLSAQFSLTGLTGFQVGYVKASAGYTAYCIPVDGTVS